MKLTAFISIIVISLAGTTLAAQTPATKAPAKPTTTATKVPAAVAAAFKQAYPTATIKHVSSEKENGKLQYEVESMDGRIRRDVIYLPDGTLVVEETAIDAAAVPAPVMAAFTARYPKATVTLYERLTKPSGVSYEMQLKGAAVKECEIAPDGTFISPKPGGVLLQGGSRFQPHGHGA